MTMDVEALTRDADSRLEAVQAMQCLLVGLQGRASNRAGTVHVTVNPAGALVDLRLGEAVRDMRAEDIAAEIMATQASAQATVAEDLRRVVGGVLPQDQLDALMTGRVADSTMATVDDELASLRADRERRRG